MFPNFPKNTSLPRLPPFSFVNKRQWLGCVVFRHKAARYGSPGLTRVHQMGVRDGNDLSNAQTTWKLSNAFKPQAGSHNAHH